MLDELADGSGWIHDYQKEKPRERGIEVLVHDRDPLQALGSVSPPMQAASDGAHAALRQFVAMVSDILLLLCVVVA